MNDLSTPVTGKGYFLMQRAWRDYPDLFKEETFTEREALAYLIESAEYEERTRLITGLCIRIEAGQLVSSYRFLAKKWRWHKDRVSSFLSRLERIGWITMTTDYSASSDSLQTESSKPYNKRPSLININHYNELQRRKVDFFDGMVDSSNQKFQTAFSQKNDKPNQNQLKQITEITNRAVGKGFQGDSFLFERFPQVDSAEEFILYMPMPWQNFALQEAGWPLDWVEFQSQEFWKHYSGKSPSERNLTKLVKRTSWQSVWQKWCQQKHRQPKGGVNNAQRR